MLLYAGYNIITASQLSELVKASQERFGVEPVLLSIVQFLQSVNSRKRMQGDCVQIVGLIDLWEGQNDDGVAAMQQEMRKALHDNRNWLEDGACIIFFLLPEGIELMPGDNNRLDVRLHGGRYIPLHTVFGRPIHVNDGHYRWAFSIDS